jgi:hypothetical protein
LGKFDKKKYRVIGRVRVNLIPDGSDFGSNIVRLFWVLGNFGSDWVGFQILNSSGHLRFRVIQIQVGSGSGHLISSSLDFQVILGQAWPCQVLFSDVLFWIGLDFRSSD